MPAFSIAGRLSKFFWFHSLENKDPDETPSGNAYQQIHDTIEGKIAMLVISYKTVRDKKINSERKKKVKEVLEERKQRFQKLREENKTHEEEGNIEENPIAETGLTLQFTYTKTRTERTEQKQQIEKPPSPEPKATKIVTDKKNIPPGPGQYDLSRNVFDD